MLIYIANTLKEAFYGHYIYRMGGDEFLVLSTNVDVDFWENVQQVVNDEIDRQIIAKKIPYHFGMSFGYCISNKENGITFEECRKTADSLMYEDKKMRKAEKAT